MIELIEVGPACSIQLNPKPVPVDWIGVNNDSMFCDWPQVRDVGRSASVRNGHVDGDVLAHRSQHVHHPGVHFTLGPISDPPAAGTRSPPPAHAGSGAQARLLQQRHHALLTAGLLLFQSAQFRQRQRHQVS